jgi:hypothetical protein
VAIVAGLRDAVNRCRSGADSFDYSAEPFAAKEIHMQYMLLIYGSEAENSKMSPAEGHEVMQGYMTFTQSVMQSGQMKAGDALEGTSTATTVRVRNGKTAVTDGPFAETREQLGGYYMVEAKDLDEAIGIAARIPGAKYGCVEVRPIRKIPM